MWPKDWQQLRCGMVIDDAEIAEIIVSKVDVMEYCLEFMSPQFDSPTIVSMILSFQNAEIFVDYLFFFRSFFLNCSDFFCIQFISVHLFDHYFLYFDINWYCFEIETLSAWLTACTTRWTDTHMCLPLCRNSGDLFDFKLNLIHQRIRREYSFLPSHLDLYAGCVTFLLNSLIRKVSPTKWITKKSTHTHIRFSIGE